MTSQTDDCFTRLLLKKYPLITDHTIDCLINDGFTGKDLLVMMDVDADIQELDVPKAQKKALKKIILKIQSKYQKTFDDTLDENLFADINEIDTQLANNSSATEPLAESSTPQPSPTPPTTTTAIIISSDESLSLSPLKTSGNNRKKQFACDWPGCEYSTHWKSHLTAHGFTHLSVKPFKCEYNDCRKSYTTKGNLSNHISADHLKVRYHCNYGNCGISYRYKSDLIAHKNSNHK